MGLFDRIMGVYRGADRGGRIILLLPLFLLPACCLTWTLTSMMTPDARSTGETVATVRMEKTQEAIAAAASSSTVARQVETATLPTTAPTLRSTETATPRPTRTLEPTATVTHTPTPRPTHTPTPTATSTVTRPPTLTPSPSVSPSPPATLTPTLLPTATQPPGEVAVVTSVIDGDTIEVSLNGAVWRVRYIGMDTPEVGEVCGSEATAANAALVAGQTVRMLKDVSETDPFGRLLRYVYVGDTFVNGALVAGGWARAVDYPPDTAMSGVLHGLAAQGAGIGCALVAAPLPTAPIRGPEPPPPPSGNCHPSYPTVCIPPPPPDLDCRDVPYGRFQVVGDDPHGFDGDNDGIGCESN